MKKNHLILFILLGLNLSSVYSIQAFAVQQEESQTEENQISKNDVEQYLQYIEQMQNTELTPEEEAAGYQIINNQKYSPEELVGDSGENDVILGGVQPSSATGYVTFAANVPEYIHEEVYVHVINLNTYKIYGCRLFEGEWIFRSDCTSLWNLYGSGRRISSRCSRPFLYEWPSVSGQKTL